MSHWTDDELRTREFTIHSRPDADPTLRRERPALSPLTIVVHDYDITPPVGPDRLIKTPMVWCALCQKVNHWIGWVAESADGEHRFLIGRHCAKRHLGAERHGKMVSLYREQAQRAAALRRLDEIRPHLRNAGVALQALADDATISAVSEWRLGLRSNFPSLARALQDASRQAPAVLLKSEKVRDYAAEERAQQASTEDVPPRYMLVYRPEVTLPFGEIFTTGFDPRRQLAGWNDAFVTQANTLLRPSDQLSTSAIEKAVVGIVDVAKSAGGLRASLEHLPDAFARSLWKAIVIWANRELRDCAGLIIRKDAIVSDQAWPKRSLPFPVLAILPGVDALSRLSGPAESIVN